MEDSSRVPNRFTRLYIAALSMVAFLTFLGQILVQNTIQNQLNDSWLINFAGRQRFQSQLISKNALLLSQRPDLADRNLYLYKLKNALADWESHHEQLRTGNIRDRGTTIVNSPEVQRMFREIQPAFTAVRDGARQVLAAVQRDSVVSPADVEASLAAIYTHELAFLAKMDEIVFQYDHEASAKVEQLRLIEGYLMVLIFIVLLIEGLFVFRPAVNKLYHTIVELMESERRTAEANKKLQDAYHLLNETKEKLIAATRLQYQQELHEQRIRMSGLMQGQEEERKRMSKELHDGIGQMLTGLKLIAENFSDTSQWTARDQANATELRNMLTQTIGEVRAISNNLMPPVLSDFGLSSALKQLVDSSQRNTGTQLIFESNFTRQRLDRNVEVGCYRIAQEALNNAIKHAEAAQIRIVLESKPNELRLMVADDGKGFKTKRDTNNSRRTVTQGLHNMRERAHLLNGQLRLSSTPGKGTQLLVRVPI